MEGEKRRESGKEDEELTAAWRQAGVAREFESERTVRGLAGSNLAGERRFGAASRGRDPRGCWRRVRHRNGWVGGGASSPRPRASQVHVDGIEVPHGGAPVAPEISARRGAATR